MKFETRIGVLRARYPLPAGWLIAEPFVERLEVGLARLCLVGLMCRGGEDIEITGSAVEEHDPPLDRAYFELLERAALLHARSTRQRRKLLDIEGRCLGAIEHDGVFPADPAPSRLRNSLSNGTALHATWRAACESARAELIERDRVLRAWEGGAPPIRLAGVAGATLTGATAGTHRVEAYRFDGERDFGVVGVFAFPERAGVPLAYGFGASENAADACRRAERECLQRLAFLWGEELPSADPEPAPTPAYHQEFYLCPKNHGLLMGFLSGTRAGRASRVGSFDPRTAAFVDLTPASLRGRLFVAKAVAEGARPLRFGYDGEIPHPIA